jgi:hypothetical protein
MGASTAKRLVNLASMDLGMCYWNCGWHREWGDCCMQTSTVDAVSVFVDCDGLPRVKAISPSSGSFVFLSRHLANLARSWQGYDNPRPIPRRLPIPRIRGMMRSLGRCLGGVGVLSGRCPSAFKCRRHARVRASIGVACTATTRCLIPDLDDATALVILHRADQAMGIGFLEVLNQEIIAHRIRLHVDAMLFLGAPLGA